MPPDDTEATDMPTLYVIGSNMLEAQLRQYVQELSQTVNGQAAVKYVDIESEDGARLSEELDIAADRLPGVLIIEADESVYKDWYGEDLPDAETVTYELSQLTGAID